MTDSARIVLKSRTNRTVYAYWRARAGANPMPARRDIDPIVDLGPLVKSLVLIDAERDPLRFRFRLVGTLIVDLVGEDMTGQYLDEVVALEERIGPIRAGCRTLVDLGEATVSRARFPANNAKGSIDHECLLMPLSDDGKNINMILGVCAPLDGGI